MEMRTASLTVEPAELVGCIIGYDAPKDAAGVQDRHKIVGDVLRHMSSCADKDQVVERKEDAYGILSASCDIEQAARMTYQRTSRNFQMPTS